MEDLRSEMEGANRSTKNIDKQIQWRRTKVLELSSQGNTQSDIAKTLRVGEATISRDISYLRQQARLNLKTHINAKLPEEYQNCMTGINQVLRICWEIVSKSTLT
jgi:DNA-binding NarL/FixJ family response regulator